MAPTVPNQYLWELSRCRRTQPHTGKFRRKSNSTKLHRQILLFVRSYCLLGIRFISHLSLTLLIENGKEEVSFDYGIFQGAALRSPGPGGIAIEARSQWLRCKRSASAG